VKSVSFETIKKTKNLDEFFNVYEEEEEEEQ